MNLNLGGSSPTTDFDARWHESSQPKRNQIFGFDLPEGIISVKIRLDSLLKHAASMECVIAVSHLCPRYEECAILGTVHSVQSCDRCSPPPRRHRRCH